METLRNQGNYASLIDSLIKRIDIFGQPIGLYYNGNPTYQTKAGGICTITIGLILLGYILSQMDAVIRREYEIQHKTQKFLEYEDSSTYSLNSSEIDFLYYLDYDYERNPEVFEKPWRYYQVDLIQITKNSTHRIEQFSSEEWCLDQEERKDLYFPDSINIEDFTCFDFNSLKFQGTFGSDELSYYRIQFHQCSQEYLDRWGYDDICANESLINDVIEQSVLKFIFFEQVFDENELDKYPIRSLPEVHYFNFKADFSASYQVQVNKNYVNLQDSWLYSTYGEKQLAYYDFEFQNLIIGSQLDNHPLFEILLKKGFTEKISKRKARNIADSLSDIGGLLSILRIGIAFLIGDYVRKSYYSSIISKMFKFQANSKKEYEKQGIKVDPPEAFKGLKEHFYSSLASSVLNRKAAQIDTGGTFWYCKNLRSKTQKYFQAQMNKKINEQFSIINVLKQLRELKIISFLLLTKEQRYLLPYTFGNIIRSNNVPERHHQGLIEKVCVPVNNGEATPGLLKKHSTLLQLQMDSEEWSRQQIALTPEQKQKKTQKFLQKVIRGVKDDKANQELLKQLINVEERDFVEQLIMLQNIEDEQDPESSIEQLPFKFASSPLTSNYSSQLLAGRSEQEINLGDFSCKECSNEESKGELIFTEGNTNSVDEFSNRLIKKNLQSLQRLQK